jgi:hypothetical protein
MADVGGRGAGIDGQGPGSVAALVSVGRLMRGVRAEVAWHGGHRWGQSRRLVGHTASGGGVEDVGIGRRGGGQRGGGQWRWWAAAVARQFKVWQ